MPCNTTTKLFKKEGASEIIIYIAGKYYAKTVGERLKNTHKAIDWGIKIYNEKGHYPLIPHTTHWIEERMDYLGMPPRENEFWYAFDNIIIPKCDAIFKFSKDGESKGADAEEKLAKKLGLIMYKSFDDIPHINEMKSYDDYKFVKTGTTISETVKITPDEHQRRIDEGF